MTILCRFVLLLSLVAVSLGGCKTWHYTDTRLGGFFGEAGATLDPDELVDGARSGISLRALTYYDDGDAHYSIPTGGTWTVKFDRPYQEFVMVAAPPAGLETIEVMWGLTADGETPWQAYTCAPGRLCKYQFTVPNNRSGDVQLTVRALYGVRFVNRQSDVREEEVAVYTLHFSTSRFDGILNPG